MKIQIRGNEKKVKQLIKELIPRCKRDGLELIFFKKIEKKEEVEIKKKPGRPKK